MIYNPFAGVDLHTLGGVAHEIVRPLRGTVRIVALALPLCTQAAAPSLTADEKKFPEFLMPGQQLAMERLRDLFLLRQSPRTAVTYAVQAHVLDVSARPGGLEINCRRGSTNPLLFSLAPGQWHLSVTDANGQTVGEPTPHLVKANAAKSWPAFLLTGLAG